MCGLIGVSGTSDAAKEVFLGLMNLQHRGQDGAGILTLGGNGAGNFNLQKGSGLVENIFSERTFKGLRGQVAIGHTRYATIGRKDPNLLQPFLDYRAGIGLGHNGNIVNVYALRRELVEQGLPLPASESDSEMILRLIANHLLETAPKVNGGPEKLSRGDEPEATDRLFSAIEHCMNKMVGAYSVVGLDASGSLFGFRDPHGIRPLVLGTRIDQDGKPSYALASETIALRYLGYNDAQEIGP